MKKGFVLPLVFFVLAGAAIYYYLVNNSTPPNRLTLETLKYIEKLPNATSWEIKNNNSFCPFSSLECTPTASILFTSDNKWPEIYRYYRARMVALGWTTNSAILTSIPTSIIFSNGFGCEVTLTTQDGGFFDFEHIDNGKFKFTAICPQTYDSTGDI